MRISYDWLKDYIKTDLDPEAAADILTNTGLEVEHIERFETVERGLAGCMVGEVVSCEPHPNADRLSVTKVDTGGGSPLPIVCGAPNVRKGQKVVVATVGATLLGKDGPFTLKKVRLRGEVSEGMICAEDEIGLGDSHEGIMVLDPDAKTGTPASEYFGLSSDTVFEIGLTPNRIDGASHFGAARDLAACLKLNGKKSELVRPETGNFSIDNNDRPVEVVIENTEACRRYTGITLSGLKVDDSPAWLRNRLLAVGLTPINNVVDATNYVLYELGQPLHAFDADRIRGNKVVVRTMKEGTKFVTLDQQERKLSSSDLMICNTEEGMCIAGVLGGLTSGITPQTRNIFLESAWFDPSYVRGTSRRHGISTDASFRFERGADPEMTVFALKRAAAMIRELAGGTISSDIVDVYPKPFGHAEIPVSYAHIDRLIGKDLDPKLISSILASLDIETLSGTKEGFIARVPPYRVDVTREADVIEEVLRIYGYNNVEIPERMTAAVSFTGRPDKDRLRSLVSEYLTGNGFNEMVCNSLTRESYYEGNDDVVNLANPISSDLGVLRKTMVFGGLETIAYNTNRQRPDLMLYEFGTVFRYLKEQEQAGLLRPYREEEYFALFMTGNAGGGNWTAKAVPASFFRLKAYTDNILERLGIRPDGMKTGMPQPEYISDGISNSLGKLKITQLGIIKKEILSIFDIKSDVYYAEINWTNLLKCLDEGEIAFSALPRFPEVRRDLSMELDRNIGYAEIRELAYATEQERLQDLSLFDVYEGKKIAEGKKSYAVSFVIQDKHSTLTDQQIDQIMDRLAGAFERKLGARIRKS